MKTALLFALASAALLSACTERTVERTITTQAPDWDAAREQAYGDTIYTDPAPTQQVIIMPGYYGASHYATNPSAYYRDPHSAYFDMHSSAYHRSYAQEAKHEAATGRRWTTAMPARSKPVAPRTYTAPHTTPAPAAAPRAYAAPRYTGYSTTASKAYSAPAPAPRPASTPKAYTAPRTYSAPVSRPAPRSFAQQPAHFGFVPPLS